MSKRKKYIKNCEVSEVIAVKLLGYEQKISIEGKSNDLQIGRAHV